VDNLKFLAENAKRNELSDEERKLSEEAAEFTAKFDEAMDDDFNTADALSVIFELVKFANTNAGEQSGREFIELLKGQLVELSDICGLIVDRKAELLDTDIEALIEERQAARKAKNFARADEIRNELLEKGIVLEDTREGVKWKRA
jgi:cysteinyl-tRNA synthetase